MTFSKNTYNIFTKVFTGIVLLFIFYLVLFGEAKYLAQYIIFMIVFLFAFGYSAYKTIILDQEDFEKSVSPFVVLKLSDNRYYPTYENQYIGYENFSGIFWLSSKTNQFHGYDSYEEAEGICRSYYDKYLKPPVEPTILETYPIDITQEPSIRA